MRLAKVLVHIRNNNGVKFDMKLSHALFAASICVALTSVIGCSDGSSNGSSSSTAGTGGTGGGTTASSSSGGENKTLGDLVFEDKVGALLAKKSMRQYKLLAKYSDGTTGDVTKDKDTKWLSSAPDVATVVEGLVTTQDKTGTVTITAEYQDKKAEDSFGVGP